MNHSSFDIVAEILSRQFKIDAQKIHPTTKLKDLGLDSLALIDFVFHLEDQLNLRIPEERLDPQNTGLTLADVCTALDDGLAQKAAAESCAPVGSVSGGVTAH
jgi:acyl carrier protein